MACHMLLSCIHEYHPIYEMLILLALFGNFAFCVYNVLRLIQQIIAYMLPPKMSIGIDTLSCNIPAQIENVIVVVRENIYKTIGILYKCIENDQHVKHLINNHKSFTSNAIDEKLKKYTDELKKQIETNVDTSLLITSRVYIIELIDTFITKLVSEINTELFNCNNPNNIYIVMKKCDNGCKFALVKRDNYYFDI
jgi:hypothetical protein